MLLCAIRDTVVTEDTAVSQLGEVCGVTLVRKTKHKHTHTLSLRDRH